MLDKKARRGIARRCQYISSMYSDRATILSYEWKGAGPDAADLLLIFMEVCSVQLLINYNQSLEINRCVYLYYVL